MKRRKILVLIPMLGLFLTGCTFQEGFATAKHWVGQNIYHPAKDFIEGLIGKKDSKEEEQPKEDDKPTPTPTPTPTEKTLVSVAVKDAPKTVEQGGTVDKSKVKLTATYSEGDPEEVTAEEVVCDTSKVAKEVEAVAKYKGKEAKFTIEVTEKSTPPVEAEWKKLTAQPEVGKTYALILDREEASSNPGLWFLTGKAESEVKDGGKDYYLVTSQSEDDAAAVQVIAGEGGFKVKIGTRYLAMFETENNNKKYTNVGLKESESDATVLTYDETIGFYGVFNTDKNYGLGTRNDQAYTTVGAVDFSTHPENYKACLYEKENVTPVVPTVSSVTVSPDSLALEVGKPGQKLTAVVAGENNPSQEVTWHSDDEAIATVSEEGVVNAVAAGTAHITAKSVADTSKVSNACTVTVTQPTEEVILQSITVTGDFKKEYTEGDHLDLTGIVVTANYSDNTHPTVTDWTSVPANGAVLSKDDTSLVVSYGGKPADAVTLTINKKAAEKGTEENPYSVSEAHEVFASLDEGKNTDGEVYVEGFINSSPAPVVSGSRGTFYLTDGVCSTDICVVTANNVGNAQTLSLADIPVGGKAVVKGAIKNNSGTFQICYIKDVANCCLAKATQTPVITSVGDVVGPAEVGLNGNIEPSEVTVEVVYSNIVEAVINPTSVSGVYTTSGKTTVDVVVDGWSATLHFDTTVASEQILKETLVYKLDGTDNSENSKGTAYSGITDEGKTTEYKNYSIQNGLKWWVEGNVTMNPWRVGGKKAKSSDPAANYVRVVKSSGVVTADDVTKVELEVGNASGITVNSVKLLVGTAEGAKDIDEVSVTFVESSTLTFSRPEGHNWSGRYFTFEFDVTINNTSNKFLEFKGASFYAMK